MVAGLLLGLIMMMKLLPDIPAAKSLHHAFVEAPLAKLAEWDRRHVIYGVVAVFLALSCGQSLVMLGASDILLVMAWDIALYVDAAIASWMIAATARTKGFWQYLKLRAAGLFRVARPRAPRRARIHAQRPANDSDGDGRNWRYALAA